MPGPLSACSQAAASRNRTACGEVDSVTRTRLLVLPALALLAAPLLTMPSHAATSSAAPTFREYPSPVGANVSVGLPVPNDVGGLPFVPDQQMGLADRAGEPTIGINPKTGAVLFQAKQQTVKVTGFDSKGPGTSIWQDITQPVEGLQTSDPFIYTDTTTGRTFVNQLELQGCSLQAFTDDDGKTYTQSVLGCGPGIAFDHQSIVTGKRTEGSPRPAPIGYPNFLYYCTNDIVDAACATSIDGGLTFLPAIPVYTDATSSCSDLFGHIKTAPDGTLYLPPDGCGKKQGIYVSEDNALTWRFSPIPTSTDTGDAGHPSITVGGDGTVYFAYGSNDGGPSGRTHVVVSTDKGKTWSEDVALGADQGVKISRFPLVQAGDGDRAAVAYLGSPTEGDGNADKYNGTWRLYLSYTYDRGKTWKTYDATPASPIQVGKVCTDGTVSCLGGSRNLLDFNDMDLDLSTGRVVVALSDGCLKVAGCTTLDRLDKGLIVRQVGGQSLLKGVTAPAAGPRAGQAPPRTGPRPARPGGGTLSATGLSAALPVVGLLLLLLAAAVAARRRRAR